MRFLRDLLLIYRRQVRQSLRVPMTLVLGLLQPILYLLFFGPVFDTRSKEQAWSARGLAALADAVARAAPRPVVAIGGIDASRVAALCAAGAAGFAVISAVAGAAEPELAVRELARRWQASRSEAKPSEGHEAGA
jgi:thiamine-phosphate pyrophosphorylase